jgi:hypothetical protein
MQKIFLNGLYYLNRREGYIKKRKTFSAFQIERGRKSFSKVKTWF